MGSFLCFWAVWWICNAFLWLVCRNDDLNWELWWWLDSSIRWKGFTWNDGWGGLFENHRCGWHFHYLRWFTWVYVVSMILIGFWRFEIPILIICFLPSHSRSHKWCLSELCGLMWWGWFGETAERIAQQQSLWTKQFWSAWEMSIRERRMKWVLFVTTSSL